MSHDSCAIAQLCHIASRNTQGFLRPTVTANKRCTSVSVAFEQVHDDMRSVAADVGKVGQSLTSLQLNASRQPVELCNMVQEHVLHETTCSQVPRRVVSAYCPSSCLIRAPKAQADHPIAPYIQYAKTSLVLSSKCLDKVTRVLRFLWQRCAPYLPSVMQWQTTSSRTPESLFCQTTKA